jgi:hypothetical protein
MGSKIKRVRPARRRKPAAASITRAQGARIIALFTKISGQFDELKAIAARRSA